jgi:hypothetical protein
MPPAGRTIYRVRQSYSDIAIISKVKDGEANGGKTRETRDSKMVLGGIDSFWLVTGEKKEQKFALQREGAQVPAFAGARSPMASILKGTSVFDPPKKGIEISGPGKAEAVSFASATKLTVGYSPQEGLSDEQLAAFSKGTLHIPTEGAVSAIEVRPGHWLTSGFFAISAGRYGLGQPSLSAVPTSSLESHAETIRLGQGLVVFITQPKWAEPKNMDLRPEEEIFQSAERWLSRVKSAVSLSALSGSANPADLLRLLTASAVSDEEKADIAAVAGILSQRSDLLDILPGILGRDPTFKEMISSFAEAEKARLTTEMEDRLRAETAADTARLAAMRAEIADAETRLVAASHREVLLRSETEKHDEALRLRIETAAGTIRDASAREITRIRDEFDRLTKEVTQIAQAVPVSQSAASDDLAEEPPADAAPRFVTAEQRNELLRQLALATGLPAAVIAAILGASTDVLPVLLGMEAATVAVDIATMISGDDAAIVFCDPTKISLNDLISEEHSGLKAAIDKARSRPDALAAVALCGITNGPCEYWLPQTLELRRLGRLPRNLALIASAGTDGMRVSVPDSILRHLFPLEVTKSGASAVRFEGHWPAVGDPDPARIEEALNCLVDEGLENSNLKKTAIALARIPAWMKLGNVKDIFLRQSEWLESVLAGSDHKHNKYFIDIEG